MLLEGRSTEQGDDIYMIAIKSKGEWKKTFQFLHKNKMINRYLLKKMEKYGEKGVEALTEATPVRTGKTSKSWTYRIEETGDGISIFWCNSNFNHYVNIAMLIQYGHGTRTGGYVTGIDYINPALRPIFDKMAKEAWEEVTSE